MIFVDKDHYSKTDFQRRSARLEGWGADLLGEGHLTAVCLRHPFEVVSTVLEVRRRGGSVLLLNGETPQETAAALARDAGAKLLFHGQDAPAVELQTEAGKAGPPIQPGLFQFSSGTTGTPKLIFRSWVEVEVELRSYNTRLASGEDETPVVLVPVSHSYGLIAGVLSALERGVRPVVVADKNPKFALHMVKAHPKSLVYGVPFLLNLLLGFAKDDVRFHKLVTSGAPSAEGLFTKLKKAANELWHQYGASETGCIALGRDPSEVFEVGKPLDHWQVTFADRTDGDGEGWKEIVVTGEHRTHHTRDLGHLTAEGNLCVTGRSDDLINVSGLKVIPSEVERTIERMPEVREAAVYRTKHKVWGEAVKAKIVAGGGLTEEDIRTWCRRWLPAYKVPTVIELVDVIPKMPSGKLSRKLLQEQE